MNPRGPGSPPSLVPWTQEELPALSWRHALDTRNKDMSPGRVPRPGGDGSLFRAVEGGGEAALDPVHPLPEAGRAPPTQCHVLASTRGGPRGFTGVPMENDTIIN